MTALEVHLNGERQCVAGTVEGTVDAHFFCAGVRTGQKPPGGHLGFIINGLDSSRDEHLEWLERGLAVGDEVVVRVIETTRVDSPKQRAPSGGDRATKEAMVRRLAKELGWSITTA